MSEPTANESAAVRPARIEGHCDARFGPVREAFERNFREHGEVGAGVCVRVDGRTVVDLWGGFTGLETDASPWQRDTLVNAYSVGKGVAAALVLRLVAQGQLDLDARVASLWPEFAAHGKGELRVRELLAHRAGLPAVRERLDEDAIYAPGRVAGALAAQRPFWEPGRDHGYHVNTFGFLVAEVLQRATGHSVGRLLREHLTGPLALDFHIGLPASEHARVARVCGVPNEPLRDPAAWSAIFPSRGNDEEDTMVGHCYFNPPTLSGMGVVNTARWREAEMPSTNSHGTARAVAAVYDALLPHAAKRSPAGLPRALVEDATRTHSDGLDRILDRPSRFGAGFQLSQPTRPLGSEGSGFGHYGYGGSLGFADPAAGVAFAYLINRPGDRWQNPRTEGLIAAVSASLGG